MVWPRIFELIPTAISSLKDPEAWRARINGARANGAVRAVNLAACTLDFTVLVSDVPTEVSLGIDLARVTVSVGGVEQPDARATLALRHQLLRPVILVIEIRNLLIGDSPYRLRLEAP